MIAAVLFAALLLALAPCLGADAVSEQPAAKPAQAEVTRPLTPPATVETNEQASRFLMTYYLDPRPQLVVPTLRILNDDGLLSREAARAPFIVFIGTVLQKDSAPLADLLQFASTLPVEQAGVIYSGIWFADTDATRAALQKVSEQTPTPAVRDAIVNLLKNEPPDLTTLPINSPAILDMLWAWFLTTGDTQPLQRIITTLPWTLDRENIAQFIVGGAAQWSLTSNAIQHPAVLDYCKRSLVGQNDETQRVLQQVIDRAEEKLKAINE